MPNKEPAWSVDHLRDGVLWALVRQHVQCEAIIETLAKEHEGFKEKVHAEMQEMKKNGRLKEIILEVQREVSQSADGMWLIRNGIREDPSKH